MALLPKEELTANKTRCPWAESSILMRKYHDVEWGTPLHDERMLFEFLVLEGAQAGLSWETVLFKRDRYRQVFDGFDPEIVAAYAPEKMESLRTDPGIIRNRMKIAAAVTNARAFLAAAQEHGSFDRYIWGFVDGIPVVNSWKEMRDIPAATPVSESMSRDLKQRGFSFVGPTICYAFMQATGMVNDHLTGCFRHRELA